MITGNNNSKKENTYAGHNFNISVKNWYLNFHTF